VVSQSDVAGGPQVDILIGLDPRGCHGCRAVMNEDGYAVIDDSGFEEQEFHTVIVEGVDRDAGVRIPPPPPASPRWILDNHHLDSATRRLTITYRRPVSPDAARS
jgi:hypothetical protein